MKKYIVGGLYVLGTLYMVGYAYTKGKQDGEENVRNLIQFAEKVAKAVKEKEEEA